MGTIGDNATFTPGQRALAGLRYECDTGCGHSYTSNAADRVLPPPPAGCTGSAWRLTTDARF